MAKRDYYEVLGLSRGASDQDIKSAFRRLAKDCHPDRNSGDKSAEQRFKELNEAYEVLKDAQKRSAYDHMGHAAFDGNGRTHGFGPDFASSMSEGAFSPSAHDSAQYTSSPARSTRRARAALPSMPSGRSVRTPIRCPAPSATAEWRSAPSSSHAAGVLP